jgi:hypothetical protein
MRRKRDRLHTLLLDLPNESSRSLSPGTRGTRGTRVFVSARVGQSPTDVTKDKSNTRAFLLDVSQIHGMDLTLGLL